MKIFFVEPPPVPEWKPEDMLSTAGRRHPSKNITGEKVYSYLNLSSASVARKQGHHVFYAHCQTEGLDIATLMKKLGTIPDLVVIMVEHVTISVSEVIVSALKERNIPSVYVGPLVTAQADKFIVESSVDYILKGEWDYSVSDLAECLAQEGSLKGIDGLTFREKGKTVKNRTRELIANLDELPFPAYDLVDLSKFYESVFTRFPAATVITSRGCPYNCIYCVFPNTIYSHKFRAQSPERVLAEAKLLQDKFKVREVRYDDDTFDVDDKRVYKICELFEKNGISFRWMVQVRPDKMTVEKAKALKKAGCSMVLYGIESGNDEVLKKIRKNTTKNGLRRGVEIAHKCKLDVLNCVMLGFYWDTEETVKETIEFAFELNAEFTQFSIPTPLPGTDYYDLLKKKGFILSEDLEKGDSFHTANVDFPHLKKEFLDQNLKNIYRRYYIRPRYIGRMLLRFVRDPATVPQFFRLVKAYVKRWKEGWL